MKKTIKIALAIALSLIFIVIAYMIASGFMKTADDADDASMLVPDTVSNMLGTGNLDDYMSSLSDYVKTDGSDSGQSTWTTIDGSKVLTLTSIDNKSTMIMTKQNAGSSVDDAITSCIGQRANKMYEVNNGDGTIRSTGTIKNAEGTDSIYVLDFEQSGRTEATIYISGIPDTILARIPDKYENNTDKIAEYIAYEKKNLIDGQNMLNSIPNLHSES